MNIALYYQKKDTETIAVLQSIILYLREKQVSIFLYKTDLESDMYFDMEGNSIAFFNEKSFTLINADALFTIGGDGTILQAVTLIKDLNIPILGFNTGRLGFLASIAQAEIINSINLFLDRKYNIEQRTLIQVIDPQVLFQPFSYALNEFSILKEHATSMIRLYVYVDDIFLNSYWADGLIVATPTGSTGYSLSNGGPIVEPHTNTLIITPIASHNLTVRPLIIPDSSIIKIVFKDTDKQAIAALDSRSVIVDHPVEIELKKASFHINLIKMHDQNFFKTIREKLLWGLDIRN